MLIDWLTNRFGLSSDKKNQAAARSAKPAQPYHAVRVIPGPHACEAAKAVSDTRFLTNDAPRLPVPGCNRATCECRYKHYADRREDARRLADSGVFPTLSYREEEKRGRRPGRRKTDT